MKNVSISIKKKLETSLRRALKLSLIEMEAVENGFSEEALRYLVMSEISKKKYWGTFPNKLNSKNKLLFEQEYNILKFKKKPLSQILYLRTKKTIYWLLN